MNVSCTVHVIRNALIFPALLSALVEQDMNFMKMVLHALVRKEEAAVVTCHDFFVLITQMSMNV